MRRTADIVVLSDIHLGAYGCRAKELLSYLKTIRPRILILNGDIIDIWQFKKSFFPKDHIEVIRRILKLAGSGTKVYYLTGNHDDMLRKFGEMEFGAIQFRNKLVFQVDGKNHWVFHGDVFDVSVHKMRWLARLGGKGYDLLIRINRLINRLRRIVGLSPVSFSAKIKQKVKGASRKMSDFEQTAINIAGEKGYDYVICGHIHQPQIREAQAANGAAVTYLNSGDWIENMTALEYENGQWSLFQYDAVDFDVVNPRLQVPEPARAKEPALTPDQFVPEKGLAAFEF